MRVLVLLTLTVAVSLSYGGVLNVDPDQPSVNEKLADIQAELKGKFDPMHKQLKDVGSALWDVAKDTGKNLLGQTLQAVAGVFLKTLKETGVDVGDLIGKRGLADWKEKLVQLGEKAAEALDKAYDKAAEVVNQVIDSTLSGSTRCKREETNLQQLLKRSAATHEVEVRGILSDTLNSGIDYIKSLYFKLKDTLTPELSPSIPLTISRRAILQEAAGKLGDHLKKIHETIKPHINTITTITSDLASALGHHAGNLLKQTKADSVEKVKEIVSTLSDHLNSAKEQLSNVKDSISQQIRDIMSSLTSQ